MKITHHFKGIYKIYPNLTKKNRKMSTSNITLFISITMFCGTGNIPQNIPHIQFEYGNHSTIFHEILWVPRNIVMNLNNVMNQRTWRNMRISTARARNPPRTHRPFNHGAFLRSSDTTNFLARSRKSYCIWPRNIRATGCATCKVVVIVVFHK